MQPEPALAFDTVTINYPVDLRLAAECVDTSVAALADLNPSLLRMTTPKQGSFDLRLPAGTKEKYVSTIETIPVDMRVWWRFHKVAEGDTLAAVARRYHTTSKAIADVNNLQADTDDLPRNTKLIIPVTPGRPLEAEGTRYSSRIVRYRVRQGDTVLSVADEWGVPPEMVRKWNKLRGNDLRRGRTLIIHRPVTDTAQVSGGSKPATSARKSKKTGVVQSARKPAVQKHTVRSGETLTSIASRYNTTVAALRRDNARVASHLKPGDVLVITAVR